MSNRPKKGKALHMLDARRRGLTKPIFAHEQHKHGARSEVRILEYTGKVSSSRFNESSTGYKIPTDKPIGLFLDDERFPDQVSRCKAEKDIHWCIVRTVEEGIAFTEACIERGIKISMVSLDWDLSSAYNGYIGKTGETFLNIFWDMIQEAAAKSNHPIEIGEFRGLFIHSQAHEDMLEGMYNKRREFMRWYDDICYG